MTKLKVIASLATVPERVKSLGKVLKSLSHQVDEINVYLNGHKKAPPVLNTYQCNFVFSRDYGNLGDTGKFFWADKLETPAWHLTCDDDFFYKPKYVQRMIQISSKRYDGRPVSLHGVVLHNKLRDGQDVDWMKNGRKRLVLARDYNKKDFQVHIVGTGVMCYRTDTVKISMDDFLEHNMADVWFARACKDQDVSRYVVAHPPELAKCICPPILGGPQKKRRSGDYSKRIAEAAPWEKL